MKSDEEQADHFAPASISPEAQAFLRRGPLGSMPPWPPSKDLAAWRGTVAAMNDAAQAMFAALSGSAPESGASPQILSVDGVTVYESVPERVDGSSGVVLNFHGGAWVQGGGELCRLGTPARAQLFQAKTWSVDYRMPPDHPFPAALEDGETAYRTLLETYPAHRIIFAGDSAGANIAAGLVYRVRAAGLPLPGGLILDTPATDLTLAGDSLQANAENDTVLVGDIVPPVRLYVGAGDPHHPQVSPLYGDPAHGFPPTLILTGTRDRLLSDAVRLHRVLRKAAVPVELHVFEAQGHGGFMGTAPEDRERAAEVTRFVEHLFE